MVRLLPNDLSKNLEHGGSDFIKILVAAIVTAVIANNPALAPWAKAMVVGLTGLVGGLWGFFRNRLKKHYTGE